MRRCFQCGAMTDVVGLTRVGDGEFCAKCFRGLLDAGGDAGAGVAPARESRGAGPASSATPPEVWTPPRVSTPARMMTPTRVSAPLGAGRGACLVCDRDLSSEPAVVFLGGEICGPCSAEMAAELAASNLGPSTEPSRISAARDLAAVETEAETAEDEDAATFTPGSGTAICSGCERPMPGPGSYRLLRGKPYCPACVPFFARLPAAVYEAASEVDAHGEPAEVARGSSSSVSSSSVSSSSVSSSPAITDPGSRSPSSSPLARPGQCDCCRRALGDLAERREGFELCSACLGSDAELALSVARARHRRALARLRSKLEGAP